MPGVSASTTLQYTGIVVFVAIVIYAILYYSRSFNSVFLTHRHDTNADANLATAATDDVEITARPGPVQPLGLGDIAVLPTFTYHAAVASPETRSAANANKAAVADCCAVCLEELRDGALLRMMASCRHYFPAECIDVWLLSHATCRKRGPGDGPPGPGVAVAPLPQLRLCGAPSLPEGGSTSSGARKDIVSSSSPSPVRSPMRFEVSTGNGCSALSPSPTQRPRTTEGRACRTRSPSPVMTASNAV